MAFRLSTALRRAILNTGSVTATLNGSFIHIYSGAAPTGAGAADVDMTATSTLLATIYRNDGATAGLGLNFELDASGAFIRKVPADAWDNATPNSGNEAGIATQTATHFIITPTADGNVARGDTNPVRILGDVGTADAELNLSSTSLTQAEVQAINSFNISIPEAI